MTAPLPPDRPALGGYLRRPEVQARRRAAAWMMRQALAEYEARQRLLNCLVTIHGRTSQGRPLRLVARDLYGLAEMADRTPGELAAGRPPVAAKAGGS